MFMMMPQLRFEVDPSPFSGFSTKCAASVRGLSGEWCDERRSCSPYFSLHSPSAFGCYHLDRVAIARGMVNYAAKGLSPHFGLFFKYFIFLHLSLVVNVY